MSTISIELLEYTSSKSFCQYPGKKLRRDESLRETAIGDRIASMETKPTVQVLDLSMVLEPGMLLYPDTPPYQREEYRRIAEGDTSNNSRISLCAHAGTHVDAPRHFIEGREGIDAISPDLLLGPCRVFRLDVNEKITREDLSLLDWESVTRVLFATRNSQLLHERCFDSEFVYLDESAARFLLDKGIRVVGIDYLSIDQYHAPSHPAHHLLLGGGVVVIEAVDLLRVEPGDYELICCPLKLKGSEAAPARVFLRKARH